MIVSWGGAGGKTPRIRQGCVVRPEPLPLDWARHMNQGRLAMGSKFQVGQQQHAVVNGDLALTSNRLPDGTVTAETARRQSDGTWLWAIDKYSNG
jgi:hypothetical protein